MMRELTSNIFMEDSFLQEQAYIKATKRVKDIKGFYIHVIVNVLSIPIIVAVNLLFVPGFHFFWFAVFGILLSIIIHWLIVFGFPKFGLGKEWEEKKIKQILRENGKNR